MNITFCRWAIAVIILFSFTACQDGAKDDEVLPPINEFDFVIEPDSLSIPLGSSYQLRVKLNGVLMKGTDVTWSSNSGVVTIDDSGLITGAYSSDNVSGLYVEARLSETVFARCKISVYKEYDYKFRLILKDKGISDFNITNPGKFLSAKAIERRKRQGLVVDETDLPVSPAYIKEIEKTGGTVVAQSKWLNTVCVHCSDEKLADKFSDLPFVSEVVLVWKGVRTPKSFTDNPVKENGNISSYNIGFLNIPENYGEALRNINVNNGRILHEREFKGKGMDIAVIDGGFYNLNVNPFLKDIDLKGAKSFIYENPDMYDKDDHGIWVLSCMAANTPGYYIGTAPEAGYWLLRTEDPSGEFPVEEDYWAAAAEYADSAGVDIINTSLYYTHYNKPYKDYSYEDMDGKTAFVTRAAEMAAKKGIFVACCAGNDATWVGAPADASHVLTVGAVTEDGYISSFTSFGKTVDGRIKPDVLALGSNAAVIDTDGTISFKNGTSFATPVLCGLAACLWQAYPDLTNKELLDILKQSSDKYSDPDLPYGYGICDMEKAFRLAGEKTVRNIRR